MARNLRPGPDWIPAVVQRRLGPVTYLVNVESGQTWKRHADQLKSWSVPSQEAISSREVVSRPRRPSRPLSDISDNSDSEDSSFLHTAMGVEGQVEGSMEGSMEGSVEGSDEGDSDATIDATESADNDGNSEEHPPTRRYPRRVRARPDWYHDYQY